LLNVKAGLSINVLLYFLYVWFACIVCILEQVNKEILGRHETQGKFLLLCENNADKTRALAGTMHKQLSVGHRHTGALNN